MDQGQMTSGARVGIVHVHSDYSHDGLDSLERLREFAVERGLSFVGLTDHAEDLEPDEFEHYVFHCRSISDQSVQLIPGLEYRFPGFPGLHLLALGLKAWIDPRTPHEFVAQAPQVADLTILAHPTLCGYQVPDEVTATIDAIEVWNASYNTRYLPDPRAIRLLQRIQRARPSVVGTAGLDQHDSRNDRQTRVVISEEWGDRPLLAIKAGHFHNVGRTMAIDPYVSWGRGRMRALEAVRWAFDGCERAQDRLTRAVRGGVLRR